ncbi:hypothetical protein M514_07990, partial [Trichuris suis]
MKNSAPYELIFTQQAGNPLAAPTPLLMLSREGNTALVRDQRLLHNRMPE